MEHLVDDLMAIVNDLKGKNVILNNLGMFDVRALKAHNKESAPQRSNSPIVPFTREEVAAAAQNHPQGYDWVIWIKTLRGAPNHISQLGVVYGKWSFDSCYALFEI